MAQPLLKRFEITVLKNTSETDAAQVPASARIDIYRQGATLKTAFSFPAILEAPVEIEVHDVGRIAPGDTLHVFADGLSAASLTVDSIPDPTHLSVLNSAAMSASSGAHLVVTNDRPSVYSNPLGSGSGSSYVTTSYATGRASGYVRERRFDFVVSGDGFVDRLYPDAEGGVLKAAPSYINAADFGTIQEAIDACPNGGAVYIPAGTWDLGVHGTVGTLVIGSNSRDQGIRIFGDGAGTVLRQTDKDKDAIRFEISAAQPMSHIEVDHLRIEGDSDDFDEDHGAGSGVVVAGDWNAEAPPVPVGFMDISIHDLTVAKVGRHGIYLWQCVVGTLQNVNCLRCMQTGIWVERGYGMALVACYCHQNGDEGIRIQESGFISLLSCGSEDNHQRQYILDLDETDKDPHADAAIRVSVSGAVSIISCDIENYAKAITKTGVFADFTKGLLVQASSFYCPYTPPPGGAGTDPDTHGVYLGRDPTYHSPCHGVTIMANTFHGVENQVFVDEQCTKVAVLPQFQFNVPEGGNGTVIMEPTRAIELPVGMWTQINGTSMSLSGKGTYPNTMTSFAFVDAPASGPQGIGITVVMPGDYISGRDVKVSLVWAPGTGAPVANKSWVGRLHFKHITEGQHYEATEDGVNSQTFSYWGGEESGELQPSGPHAVVTQAWAGTIPGAGLVPGSVLRLAFDRLSTDANDNLAQAVEVFGFILDYVAYS